MRRRDFVRTSALIGVSTAIAGCNTDSTGTGTSTQGDGTATDGSPEDQQTEADPENAVRYFFDDQTGALGHLGDDNIPENADTITNSTTESEYQEMQTNDRAYAEDAASSSTAPQGTGLDMTVDQMISRAEEIYNNPTQHIDTSPYPDLDLTQEDDEIVFTRALIQASQEAGVDSSGLADDVVANIAEDAVQQIQPGFTNYKLSTLPATEPIGPESTGATGGGERSNEWNQTFVNSGFSHMIGLLQYEKNGEVEVKYAEQTDSTNENAFRRVIRDPENSLYTSPLDMESVSNARDSEAFEEGTMFPEHYVTAFDYEKARELEDEGILGLGENQNGNVVSAGSYIGRALFELVDDMGITGYDVNPDRDLSQAQAVVNCPVVSDSFGSSLENFRANPTTEKRQNLEYIARGLYQIQESEGWGTPVGLEGTIEDPELIPTDRETMNQIRQEGAYDEVRSRAT